MLSPSRALATGFRNKKGTVSHNRNRTNLASSFPTTKVRRKHTVGGRYHSFFSLSVFLFGLRPEKNSRVQSPWFNSAFLCSKSRALKRRITREDQGGRSREDLVITAFKVLFPCQTTRQTHQRPVIDAKRMKTSCHRRVTGTLIFVPSRSVDHRACDHGYVVLPLHLEYEQHCPASRLQNLTACSPCLLV